MISDDFRGEKKFVYPLKFWALRQMRPQLSKHWIEDWNNVFSNFCSFQYTSVAGGVFRTLKNTSGRLLLQFLCVGWDIFTFSLNFQFIITYHKTEIANSHPQKHLYQLCKEFRFTCKCLKLVNFPKISKCIILQC